MALEWVVKRIEHNPSATTIGRFTIDMPIRQRKVCLIRQVQVLDHAWGANANRDMDYIISIDPDHATPTTLESVDPRFFVKGRHIQMVVTEAGQQIDNQPVVFMYPEGIVCAHGRLIVFIQHSNASAAATLMHITVFFEYRKMTAEEVTIAVVRRGRGESRRIT